MNKKDNKHSLRVKYKKIRETIPADLEKEIVKEVIYFTKKLIKEQRNNNSYLGIYWPLKGEVNLTGLKEVLNFPIALPSINESGEIQYIEWNNNSMDFDYAGIPSPKNGRVLEAKDLLLLLVPSIAIDRNGYRIGYGGGFFDKLRSKSEWRSITAMAVIPNKCILNKPIDHDSWDIPLDGWISEQGKELSGNNKYNI